MEIARLRLLSPDPARLRAFYVAAFAAEETSFGVRLGEQDVEIAASAVGGGVAFAAEETGFQHFALVVAQMGAAYAALRGFAGWRPISLAGPERLPPASGGASAFKFRDPDGHPLELLQFPEERTPDDWRARFAREPTRLFYGVDHTAVTVSDADKSLPFYRQLKFYEARRQLNKGPEQARLDGLSCAEADVEIVSLASSAGRGPGVELLAYKTPPVRRATARDGSPAATVVILRGNPESFVRDPDNHRFATSNDV